MLLAYFGSFPSHFHQDELETAYASYKLPPFAEIDWLGPYPHTDAWVAKFPILFFALQAPFLKLLGPSLESVRLSTWPYQALTVVYLYLLARRLLADRLLAAAAILLYLLFAPALYLGSLGVHFHSSTLFLLAALHHAVVLLERPSRIHAAALGAFTAASYLTYTASYLALPLVAAVVALGRAPLRRFALAGLVFVLVLAPFAYGALTRHNYFLQRSGQAVGRPTLEHVWRSVRSLREDGLVGVTGYDFGRLAPLDDLTLALVVVGTAVALYRRRVSSLLPLVVCLAAFTAGMVLTTPAGALHRAVVAYPFVGLLCAQALAPMRRWWPAVVAVVVVAAAIQLPRAVRMVEQDQSHPSPQVAALLAERVPPGERITIVGLLHYHLARELTIRLGDRYEVVAAAWPELPSHLGAAVVVHQPNDEKLARIGSLMPGPTEVTFFEGGEMNDHALLLRAR